MLHLLRRIGVGSWGTRHTIGTDCVSLLRAAGINPVLVDVGSAGVSHSVWRPIASESIVVGFDADARNKDKEFGQGYARAIMVNKAVTADDRADTVEFILTDYPSCSSMLEPDLDALESFSFRDYFKPVGKEMVPATSLNRVVESERLGGIHWLKLDSQGADLRLLKSISRSNLDELLAVDIEPGLIHAYKEEDSFTDCHDWLLSEGFWLSRLEYQSYPKIRPDSLAALGQAAGLSNKELLRRLTAAPTAVEGRYLREIRWLSESDRAPEAFILAAVFGLVDGHVGYAFDVFTVYVERFGNDRCSRMIEETAHNAVG